MNRVMISNLEVIITQTEKMFDEVNKDLVPLVMESKGKYTKEQFLLEDRLNMLADSLTGLKALLETQDMTPEEHEQLIIQQGGCPRKCSSQARSNIAEYMCMEDPELEEKALMMSVMAELLEMLKRK